jgi:hypothetical protein
VPKKSSIVSTNSTKSYVHIVLGFAGLILEEYWERGMTYCETQHDKLKLVIQEQMLRTAVGCYAVS